MNSVLSAEPVPTCIPCWVHYQHSGNDLIAGNLYTIITQKLVLRIPFSRRALWFNGDIGDILYWHHQKLFFTSQKIIPHSVYTHKKTGRVAHFYRISYLIVIVYSTCWWTAVKHPLSRLQDSSESPELSRTRSDASTLCSTGYSRRISSFSAALSAVV